MTDESWGTKRLIVLRRVTRAIADLLHGQLKDYLSALAPLFRPASILGEYVQGGSKEMSAAAIKAFQELQSVYGAAASSKPFGLSKDLKSPLEIARSSLELNKMDYPYTLKSGGETKSITISAPLKWQLTYADFTPSRLKQLLADPNRTDSDASRFVLHYSVLHVVMARQAGATQMLGALHYNLSSVRMPEFGELPITCIASSVPTIRPPDEVVLESVEISGQNAFEEVVDVEGIVNIQDPFKEQLMNLIKTHGV
ncbi:MAG: hypothetical protein ABSG32_01035 [Terriglobia bacterium]|jgi:hypothetical protein